MAETPKRPLLILPIQGELEKREKRKPFFSHPKLPKHQQQTKRLSPKFEALEKAFEEDRIKLQQEASGLEPEKMVVLEIVGKIDNFINAIKKIEGMELLAEKELLAENKNVDTPLDNDFFNKENPQENFKSRIFMSFMNQRALEELRSLWKKWKSKGELPDALRKWEKLFMQLYDIRPWGPKDRYIETGIIEEFQKGIGRGDKTLPCEIELWSRESESRHSEARDRVADLVRTQEGTIISEVSVDEICYHSLLVHLPAKNIKNIEPFLSDPKKDKKAGDIKLFLCDDIQYIKPSTQMAAPLSKNFLEKDQESIPEERLVGKPIAALLDGFPLQGHRRLQGRLIIDDPDNYGEDYPALNRCHGTAMASLIIHGDMGKNGRPITKPLYVRPILRPTPSPQGNGTLEAVPEDTLIVDLLHRSITHLFEKKHGIAIINLSIGMNGRPFEGELSPLARLLDWLAWKYKILFIVSAGNYTQDIQLDTLEQRDTLELPLEEIGANEEIGENLQKQILHSIARDARNRRLLSPAEAVNVITVGAVHEDVSTDPIRSQLFDPYPNSKLPSLINAQGMGYQRGIKPELLEAGGRVLVKKPLDRNSIDKIKISPYKTTTGQCVAAPGKIEGSLEGKTYTQGTSNAAALVSRAANQIYDVVEELRGELGGEIIDTIPRSIWLKALLAHSAKWGKAGKELEEILRNKDNSRHFKEYITRLLGYGKIDTEQVQKCTPYRVTAISGGILEQDKEYIHRFPLPKSLSKRRDHRLLTITLAWLSPINPRDRRWRVAALWFEPLKVKRQKADLQAARHKPLQHEIFERKNAAKSKNEKSQDPLKTERQEADWQAVRRGTLQHEIFQITDATEFEDGENLEVKISCRATVKNLKDKIPYALVITLKVHDNSGVAIYDEIKTSVQTAHRQKILEQEMVLIEPSSEE